MTYQSLPISSRSFRICWKASQINIVNGDYLILDKRKTMDMIVDCNGENGTADCCTDDSPCKLGDGDCDTDSNCAGDFVCGFNNCRDFNRNADYEYDCCMKALGKPIQLDFKRGQFYLFHK